MDVKWKNISLKNKLVMLKHMVSMTINNLKATLKNVVYLKNTNSSPATHSRIQSLVPNKCYVVVVRYAKYNS